ncbi:hypothetical protein BDD12DRAFT_343216 [Trichophaea hybrida]|nr:hypothetical protein BDD12DRAFT_343216 [Trichophaea hybrida]
MQAAGCRLMLQRHGLAILRNFPPHTSTQPYAHYLFPHSPHRVCTFPPALPFSSSSVCLQVRKVCPSPTHDPQEAIFNISVALPMSTTAPRTRTGCTSCRVRHLKFRGYNVRFRYGTDLGGDDPPTGGRAAGGKGGEFRFEADQWLSTLGPIGVTKCCSISCSNQHEPLRFYPQLDILASPCVPCERRRLKLYPETAQFDNVFSHGRAYTSKRAGPVSARYRR